MNNSFIKAGMIVALSSLTFMACDKENKDDDKDMERTQLYVTNNNDGNVTMYDLDADEITTYRTTSTMTEGVYYDGALDEMIVASRSFNYLSVYDGMMEVTDNSIIPAAFSSAADLSSPRDIAVKGNLVVVADNADVDSDPTTADGRLFIYTKTGNSLILRNTVTTDFAVWGIEFVDNNLYAIVDKTNMLAVFNDFLDANRTDATVSANKKIMIEGIVRTHGLAYDDGTMILTDIGDAAVDSDGGFHIIKDFKTKFVGVADGAMLPVAGNQIRVAGPATLLGNPVSAEYDAANDMVYIAEAANGGGRVLGFATASTGGDLAPTWRRTSASASSLYFYRD